MMFGHTVAKLPTADERERRRHRGKRGAEPAALLFRDPDIVHAADKKERDRRAFKQGEKDGPYGYPDGAVREEKAHDRGTPLFLRPPYGRRSASGVFRDVYMRRRSHCSISRR